MTTVESQYDVKVRELLQNDPDAAIEYMLRAAPFLREYNTEGEMPDDDDTSADYGFKVESTKKNHDIYCRYMAEVEGDYAHLIAKVPKRGSRQQAVYSCPDCKTPKRFIKTESSLACPECGTSTHVTEYDASNLSFDETIVRSVNRHGSYKRANYFAEWLNSLQARESTVIPDDVLDAVRAEFKKNRATTRADITPKKVLQHLKKLRLRKWFEHKYALCTALEGIPPPELSPALEVKLKAMFNEIHGPFDKWRPVVAPTRKNFLSYGYVLYKFCELLGQDDLLDYFTLLKDGEKLYQMDVIWRKICEEVGWEFIPTV